MRRTLIVTGALALLLAGCGGGPTPIVVRTPASSRPVSPAPGASPADPSAAGCAMLRDLGMAGTPDRYRGIAAVLAGTGDAQLAAAAVRLHDATGTTLEPVDTGVERVAMFTAVLDVAEQCLRVVGQHVDSSATLR